MALSDDDNTTLRTLIREETTPQFARLSSQIAESSDQLLRAFQMTEENIRQDAAHIDELQELRTRVERLEERAGLSR